jgi:hypothetical protein
MRECSRPASFCEKNFIALQTKYSRNTAKLTLCYLGNIGRLVQHSAVSKLRKARSPNFRMVPNAWSHDYLAKNNSLLSLPAIEPWNQVKRGGGYTVPKDMRFSWNSVKVEGIKFYIMKFFTLWNLILLFSRYFMKIFRPFGTVYLRLIMTMRFRFMLGKIETEAAGAKIWDTIS